MAYLTPETITAALAINANVKLPTVFEALNCTVSGPSGAWSVWTSDAALVFTGTSAGIWTWLRNSDPTCTFAELSPMRRDRLVAAFVSPGRDLLGEHRAAQWRCGAYTRTDTQHVSDIWDCFARHAGWSYLQTLKSPASVATEALSQWSSQTDNDERDDPEAYDGY